MVWKRFCAYLTHTLTKKKKKKKKKKKRRRPPAVLGGIVVVVVVGCRVCVVIDPPAVTAGDTHVGDLGRGCGGATGDP
jgi:hypothetical protein